MALLHSRKGALSPQGGSSEADPRGEHTACPRRGRNPFSDRLKPKKEAERPKRNLLNPRVDLAKLDPPYRTVQIRFA